MNRVLEFTFTVSKCLGCHFCPQDKLASSYKGEKYKLSEDDFVMMISTVPKDVMIQGSGFSECLLHPDSMDMLLFAWLKGHRVGLYTTLVGLRDSHLRDMAEINFDLIRIHAPDREFFTTPENVWLSNLDRFVDLKKGFTVMAMGPLTDRLNAELDRRGVPVEMPRMLSRAGNLGWVHDDRPVKGRIKCQAERQKQNVVLPNGDVVGCSMMYGLEVPLGNLLTQPYSEIEAAADKWIANFNDTPNSPCAKCDWSSPE